MDLHYVAWLCTFFCFAQVWSLPTKCGLRKHLMEKTCTSIETAGGLFPSQCLGHVPISFPQNVFESSNKDQVSGVEKAIYQTLQNIDALFEDYKTITHQWDAEQITEFRNILYRLIVESSCIMSKSDAAQDFPSREASLKVYFEAIASTLKEKDSSYCAWEIARSEIIRTLNFILKNNSDIML